MRQVITKLKKVGNVFSEKNVASMASSISFFTILSLTPFLLLFFATLILLGWQNFSEIQSRLIEALGPSASMFVKSVGPSLKSDQGGISFGFFGLLTIIYAASRIVSELKNSLETILHDECSNDYRDESSQSPIWLWLKTKMFSVAAIVFCIFLLTVSLIFSTMLTYFFSGSWIESFDFLNDLISLLFFTLIFYLMFYFLPKPKLTRKFAIQAGLLCSVFFHIGKIALETYFSYASMESSYGALSSFVVLLLWSYYNGLIILSTACIAKVFFKH